MAITTAGSWRGSPTQISIAATGANIATSNANLAVGFNVVTGGNAVAGVQLPTPVGGEVVTVKNFAGGNLGVYPHTGGGINSAAANANVLMGSNCLCDFYAINSANWATVANALAGGL